MHRLGAIIMTISLRVSDVEGLSNSADCSGINSAAGKRHIQFIRLACITSIDGAIEAAAIGLIPPLSIRQQPAAAGTRSAKPSREVWFRGTGTIAAEVHDRARMGAGAIVDSPAVVESLESTILIPPGWQARMDADGFILMARTKQGAAR